ncbi:MULTISPECIES: hypothetical protein [Phyllobacterium]|jgi:hypothetical protein|nr:MULTISPECIES: hypothetical protein [Phyllobacterium]UXN67687.1 hypothetical protein N8E89_27565 [Phyllobacterium sp. A18/5-2]
MQALNVKFKALWMENGKAIFNCQAAKLFAYKELAADQHAAGDNIVLFQ